MSIQPLVQHFVFAVCSDQTELVTELGDALKVKTWPESMYNTRLVSLLTRSDVDRKLVLRNLRSLRPEHPVRYLIVDDSVDDSVIKELVGSDSTDLLAEFCKAYADERVRSGIKRLHRLFEFSADEIKKTLDELDSESYPLAHFELREVLTELDAEYADVPDWIDGDPEHFNEVVSELEPEVCEFEHTEATMMTLEELAHRISSTLIPEDSGDVPEGEENFDLDAATTVDVIKNQLHMLEPRGVYKMVRRWCLDDVEEPEDSSRVVQVLGPVNGFLSLEDPELVCELTERQYKCYLYGHRMLVCNCHSATGGGGGEWFTGKCRCGKKIRSYHHAIRLPVLEGQGWIGCYCSPECLQKYYSEYLERDTDVPIVETLLEAFIPSLGIFDRPESTSSVDLL